MPHRCTARRTRAWPRPPAPADRTERGTAGADRHRGRRGVSTEVDITVHVTATVALPVVTGGTYQLTGHVICLGTRDGRVLYRVGAGRTGFHATPRPGDGRPAG